PGIGKLWLCAPDARKILCLARAGSGFKRQGASMNLNPYILSSIAALVGVIVGVGLVWLLVRRKSADAQAALEEARARSAEVDTKLAERYEQLQRESRDEVQAEVKRLQEIIERETAERRTELKEGDQRLRERENQLDKRLRNLDHREKAIARRDKQSE